jgi:hypothetical protein
MGSGDFFFGSRAGSHGREVHECWDTQCSQDALFQGERRIGRLPIFLHGHDQTWRLQMRALIVAAGFAPRLSY